MINKWLDLAGKRYQLNSKGYLLDMSPFDGDILNWFADQEGVEIGPDHHAVIMVLRNYFSEHKQHPPLRTITTAMIETLGVEKASVKYFHKLFPGGIHQAFRIAGLPMQDSCC